MVQYWMRCKTPGCHDLIRVPCPTPLGIFPNPEAWPKADWRACFLCLSCERAYRYTAEDLRESISQKTDLVPPLRCETFCIRFECDRENCGTPITIHVVEAAPLSIDELTKRAGLWQYEFQCPNGHTPKAPAGVAVKRCPFPA